MGLQAVGWAALMAGPEKHGQLRFLVTFPEAESDSDGTRGAGRLLGEPSALGTVPVPPVVGPGFANPDQLFLEKHFHDQGRIKRFQKCPQARRSGGQLGWHHLGELKVLWSCVAGRNGAWEPDDT